MKDGMKADNLRVKTLVADSTSAGAGEIGTAELAASAVASGNILDGNVTTAKILDNNVTRDKLAQSYIAGTVTLGTNGAQAFTGFSGGGVPVTLGSPISIFLTPAVVGAGGTSDPAYVVGYAPSGFDASGSVTGEHFYLAVESDP